MDNQHGSITEEYAKTQSGERELVKGLQDKYGVGSLNLESGTFVPAPEQPKPTETSK